MRSSKLLTAGVTLVAGLSLTAGSAWAHECTNASKNAHAPTAGAQITFGGTGIVDATNGVVQRIQHGVIDPDTGEGFHGQIGIDDDGDGAADFTIYDVGPTGSIPHEAQANGSPDHGIVNLCGGVCPE